MKVNWNVINNQKTIRQMNRLLAIMHLILGTFVFAQSSVAEVDAKIDSIYQHSKIPGMAIAIVTNDSILLRKGYGYADLQELTPYWNETIQNVASVSKTFIGVSLLKAQELGLIDLDEDINSYLPFELKNPHFPNEKITLRQIATHTSSINDRELIYHLKGYNFGSTEPKMALGAFSEAYFSKKGKFYSRKNFLKKKPGTYYNYSNIAAGLAAYVVEYVSGMAFNAFTEKYILNELHMIQSGWSVNDIDEKLHATVYKKNRPLNYYTLTTYPDGGLRTNILDLSIYLQWIIHSYKGKDPGIISSTSFKEMIGKQFGAENSPENVDIENDNAGIFWDYSKSGWIGHTGGDPGVTTFMYFNPETGVGCILLSNTSLEKNNQQDIVEVWKALTLYGQIKP